MSFSLSCPFDSRVPRNRRFVCFDDDAFETRSRNPVVMNQSTKIMINFNEYIDFNDDVAFSGKSGFKRQVEGTNGRKA